MSLLNIYAQGGSVLYLLTCVTRLLVSWYSVISNIQVAVKQLHLVSRKNIPDSRKRRSNHWPTTNTTEGRSVCICQPGTHSQDIVPLFNKHFSVVYRPGNYTDHCITVTILLWIYQLSINFKHPGQNMRYKLMMTIPLLPITNNLLPPLTIWVVFTLIIWCRNDTAV
jgi:hypothetical protein